MNCVSTDFDDETSLAAKLLICNELHKFSQIQKQTHTDLLQSYRHKFDC
ncbi:5690_t:CDS:2, partial [Rhizophagus irregularis]